MTVKIIRFVKIAENVLNVLRTQELIFVVDVIHVSTAVKV